jgi:AraC-like DNA-binding protein
MQLADRLVKERLGSAAPTKAGLWAPHPDLDSCVRAYVTRSTLGAKLGEVDRLNYFPASPTCSITWFLQGDYAHVDQDGKLRTTDLPRPVMFTGPRTQPIVSTNPGEVDVFMVLLLPNALNALMGLDIAAQLDRHRAPEDVFDGDWMDMIHALFHAADQSERIQRIENFLRPRWQALCQARPKADSSIQHWAHTLQNRASTHAQGRSERQIDRRIKDWTGQPLRQLRGVGRVEGTLLHAREALLADQLKWADIAAAMGFSDQSHLSREFRRITGLNPRDLKTILAHESFWIYEIWT